MNVLLLTARDPLGHVAVRPLDVAARLHASGHDVILVLLEDAVTLARPDHRDAATLAGAIEAGVAVLVEEDALARRTDGAIAAGVKPTTLGAVVDAAMSWAQRQAWL